MVLEEHGPGAPGAGEDDVTLSLPREPTGENSSVLHLGLRPDSPDPPHAQVQRPANFAAPIKWSLNVVTIHLARRAIER